MTTRKITRKPTVKNELVLFKYLMDRHSLRTDEDLADFLFCAKTVISATRCGHRNLSARLILTIYDKTDLSIEEIRALAKEYM